MKEIELTQGFIALVDDKDFEKLSKYKWYYNQGYACRGININKGKRTKLLMHKIINKTPKGYHTDHINGNMLDNRKENLRTCTASENIMNSKVSKNNKVGYKGVYWRKDINRWRAKIVFNRKNIHIGHFDNPHDAAKAYNRKATELFGEYAKLNIVGRCLNEV